MFELLGYSITLPAALEFLIVPWAIALANAAAWILIAMIINFIMVRIIRPILRRLPGDLEDILFGILRAPILISILVFGLNKSLDNLSLTAEFNSTKYLVTTTIYILLVTHIIGRILRDVLVHYGEKWALRTESRVDDVLIPVLNLFGPVVLICAAAFIIFPLWGINVTSVLVGAGVIGLVLGLALQDTLNNIFSGLSLLIESPFKTGDLITLPDNRVCEVQRVGIRSTQLYSVAEHAVVYVPNKEFSSTILTNVSKPTVDQKCLLEITVESGQDLTGIQESLRRIAAGHPATIIDNMEVKIPLLKAGIQTLLSEAKKIGSRNPAYSVLMLEIERNEGAIPKLELEGRLNARLGALEEEIRNLIRGIKVREVNGLSESERQEIFCNFISPTEEKLTEVISLSGQWCDIPDPWLDHTDHWNLHRLWEKRNRMLLDAWERVKKMIYHPDDLTEMRLDDIAAGILEWLRRDYKIIPTYWKNPVATLKDFDGSTARLELSYYVDNIRLEHDERASRVKSELNHQVWLYLRDLGVWK
ncbi:MAG: mechanosensitive ion channel family protein [Anaerolineaceae bacterium]